MAGPYQFTHTAAYQGTYAAINALFGGIKKIRIDYRIIPWTTYTDPEVARVGLNRTEAEAKGIPHEAVRVDLADIDRAVCESETDGFIEVITRKRRSTILGVTIVAPRAGEIISEFVLAMKYNIGLSKILSSIHAYPTWSEAAAAAAGAWKRNHTPKWALWCLKHFFRLQRRAFFPDDTT